MSIVRMVSSMANGSGTEYNAFMEMTRSEFLIIAYAKIANVEKQNATRARNNW